MNTSKEKRLLAGWRFCVGLTVICLAAACSPNRTSEPLSPEKAERVHAAALMAFDAVAADFGTVNEAPYAEVLGPGAMPLTACHRRYANGGLIARCLAVAAVRDVAALRDNEIIAGPLIAEAHQLLSTASGSAASPLLRVLNGLPRRGDAAAHTLLTGLLEDTARLYRISRAAHETRLRQADHAFLAAVDRAVDVLEGHRPPPGRAQHLLLEHLLADARQMLTRPYPKYPANSLAGAMGNDAPLTSEDIGALSSALSEARAALSAFDSVVIEWRSTSAAITSYAELLKDAVAPGPVPLTSRLGAGFVDRIQTLRRD